MKYIRDRLLNADSGVLSMEEIDAEIAATEPAPDVVDDLVAEPDQLDQDEAELEAGADDLGEASDEMEVAADVTENLEDTVQVMEALIDGGSVSLVEFASLSDYAGTQMARLGFESFAFSAEGIDDAELRLGNLRLAVEAVAEKKEEIKKAAKASAKKMEAQSASLWDKFLALLGNRTKKVKVLLAKASKLSEKKREKVKVGRTMDRFLIDQSGPKTAEKISKAVDFFYGKFIDELTAYTTGKTETAPSVPEGVLSGLPFDARVTFADGRMSFDKSKGRSGTAFEAETMSPSEISSVLKAADAILAKAKHVGTKMLSVGMKIATYLSLGVGAGLNATGNIVAGSGSMIGFHLLASKYSKGYNNTNETYKLMVYLQSLVGQLIGYAKLHIAAYK